MAPISLCMIVKDEEQLLPRALGNLGDFADEIIVVDTGSTDDTVAVAKSLGATVIHYDWQPPGHKGAARNAGIDVARGDWIVVLDADEILQDPAGLRAWLADSEAHAAYLTFHNYSGQELSLIWSQVRAFRRGCYRYCYREHEVPVAAIQHPVEVSAPFVIEHRPPNERRAAKLEPMLARLQADVNEFPDDPHPRYFLARQYLLAEQYDAAIEHLKAYLRLAKPGEHDFCEAWGLLAHAYQQTGHEQAAVELLHRCASVQPQRRVWWIRMAEIYMGLGEINVAMGLLRLAGELWPVAEAHQNPAYYNGYIDRLMSQCQMILAERLQNG